MTRQKTSGQAMVEMALVLPLFLMILCAIYDFGCAFHIWSSLNTQCVEAARAGAVRKVFLAFGTYGSKTHASLDDVKAAFRKHRSPMVNPANYVSSQGQDPEITGVGEPNVAKIRVSIGYQFIPLTPMASVFLGGSTGITLHASAEAAKE